MKNTEIEYQLSTDYERLYNLLKEGKKVVGFYAYGSSEPDQNYSGLDAFEYSDTHKTFYVGLTIFEAEHTKEEILEFMARWNVIYFPLPESQTVVLPKICSNCVHFYIKSDEHGVCDNPKNDFGLRFGASKKGYEMIKEGVSLIDFINEVEPYTTFYIHESFGCVNFAHNSNI